MMTLTHFLGLLVLVILAAGATLALAFWAKVPLMAISVAALAGSLILGARQWR
ncbi:MAG: hypothetical protein R3D63_02570 [Paracoccaceae bacterium]